MSPAHAGLGYAAFAAAMTVGRLTGDRLVQFLCPGYGGGWRFARSGRPDLRHSVAIVGVCFAGLCLAGNRLCEYRSGDVFLPENRASCLRALLYRPSQAWAMPAY
jgi:hypothetical protein